MIQQGVGDSKDVEIECEGQDMGVHATAQAVADLVAEILIGCMECTLDVARCFHNDFDCTVTIEHGVESVVVIAGNGTEYVR